MLSQQKLKHVLQVARVVECFVGFVFVALGLAVVLRTLLSDSSSDEPSTAKGNALVTKETCESCSTTFQVLVNKTTRYKLDIEYSTRDDASKAHGMMKV